jgi:acyl-CoA thioester hydrolase
VNDAYDHVETLRVRYSDTDAQGIVHHSNYFRWLEEARIGWLDAIGQAYGDLTQRGIYLPLTTCSCTFQAPVHAGEQVDVHLSLDDVSRARVGLTYQIMRGDQLAATAATTHAYVDTTGRPLRLTRDDPFWLAIQGEP